MGLGVGAVPGVLGVAVQGRAGARREMLMYFPPSPKEQQDILGTPFAAMRQEGICDNSTPKEKEAR